ncbi:MAG: ribonuclease R [Spartobacteria bacterium]|nr:ribonuclease R [Spartobacteria bacterium]
MKEERINKLEEAVLTFMRQPNYIPLHKKDLAQAMGIKAAKRQFLRQTLKSLAQRGIIREIRGARYELMDTPVCTRGVIFVRKDGSGTVEHEAGEHYFVSEENRHFALSGDLVEVRNIGKSYQYKRSGRRINEVEVIRVIERKHTQCTGLLQRSRSYDYIIPDDPRISGNVQITRFYPGLENVPNDHKVVVDLTPWFPEIRFLSGTVIEDIGREGDPGVDVTSIIRDHGLRTTHSLESSEQAEATTVFPPEELANRVDLRDKLIFTIDPEDAKDYDDAVSLEKTDDGNWILGVHIADVPYYVKKDSPIDAEASIRATSMYLVDRVIPMLPAYLTSNVCSLLPNEDRLTHTVEMVLSPDGSLLSNKTYRSVIHSKARLDYKQVQRFINTGASTEIANDIQPILTQMYKLTQKIRRIRIHYGSVDFNLPEIKVIINDNGIPVDFEKRISLPAYQLIEEFMLLANKVVANKIIEADIPGLYRIHPQPDEEQWQRMADELKTLGITATPHTQAAINAISRDVAGQPNEAAVNMVILRNFKQAVYSAQLAGHFGLAFERYTHFTSPIRRYPDLVTHRILSSLETKTDAPYDQHELENIARQSSAMEREAMECERESVNYKLIEYYMNQMAQGNKGPYKAMVTSVITKGLIVSLTDSMLRGLIPFGTLGGDYFDIDDKQTTITGRVFGTSVRIGDVIEVEILRIDERRHLVDFRWTKKLPQTDNPFRGRRRSRGDGEGESDATEEGRPAHFHESRRGKKKNTGSKRRRGRR